MSGNNFIKLISSNAIVYLNKEKIFKQTLLIYTKNYHIH